MLIKKNNQPEKFFLVYLFIHRHYVMDDGGVKLIMDINLKFNSV